MNTTMDTTITLKENDESIKRFQLDYLNDLVLKKELFCNINTAATSYQNSFYHYRVLHESEHDDRFEADIILTVADDAIIKSKSYIDTITINKNITFYRINKSEVSLSKTGTLNLTLNNVFTPHIKITVMFIDNKLFTGPYLTCIDNRLYSQGIKTGILGYYFNKYNFDKRILRIISVLRCLRCWLFGGGIRDIIRGVSPNDLDFYVNREEEHYCVSMLECIGFIVKGAKSCESKNKMDMYSVSKYKLFDATNEEFVINIDFVPINFWSQNIDFNVNILVCQSMYSINTKRRNENVSAYRMKNILNDIKTNRATLLYKTSNNKSKNIVMLSRIQKMINYGFTIHDLNNKIVSITDCIKELKLDCIHAKDILWMRCDGCGCNNKQCRNKVSEVTYFSVDDYKEHIRCCSFCRGMECSVVQVSKATASLKASKKTKSSK
jgi:hypothetical protein